MATKFPATSLLRCAQHVVHAEMIGYPTIDGRVVSNCVAIRACTHVDDLVDCLLGPRWAPKFCAYRRQFRFVANHDCFDCVLDPQKQ